MIKSKLQRERQPWGWSAAKEFHLLPCSDFFVQYFPHLCTSAMWLLRCTVTSATRKPWRFQYSTKLSSEDKSWLIFLNSTVLVRTFQGWKYLYHALRFVFAYRTMSSSYLPLRGYRLLVWQTSPTFVGNFVPHKPLPFPFHGFKACQFTALEELSV